MIYCVWFFFFDKIMRNTNALRNFSALQNLNLKLTASSSNLICFNEIFKKNNKGFEHVLSFLNQSLIFN